MSGPAVRRPTRGSAVKKGGREVARGRTDKNTLPLGLSRSVRSSRWASRFELEVAFFLSMTASPPHAPLHELIYVSAATRPFLGVELQALLAKARVRNAACGVSGMLLYTEGSFLQILEGDEASVGVIFSRVQADRRHDRVLRLFSGPIDERSFGQWSMGFVDPRLTDATTRALTGFTNFLRDGRHAGGSTLAISERAQAVGSQFREGRWRQAARDALR